MINITKIYWNFIISFVRLEDWIIHNKDDIRPRQWTTEI